MLTATDFLFSVFPLAFRSKISIALVVTKVEASIKKISNKKTISVIDDILTSGETIILLLKSTKYAHLSDLLILRNWLPFDTLLYLFLPLNGCKLYSQLSQLSIRQRLWSWLCTNHLLKV